MEKNKQESDSFLKDLKTNIKLRLGNKLIFSYLIAWCIWNWKFLLFIIFSGKSIEEKLTTYSNYLSEWDPFIPIIGVVFYYLALDWLEGFFLFVSQWGVDFRLQRYIEIEGLKAEAEIEISQERINIINEFAQTNKQELNQAVEINDKLQRLEKTEELQERMKGGGVIRGNGPVPSNDPKVEIILDYFDKDTHIKDAFYSHANNISSSRKSNLDSITATILTSLELIDDQWKLTIIGNGVFYRLLYS